MKNHVSRIAAVAIAGIMILPGLPVQAEGTPEVVINEVESKDSSGGPDWIEILNTTDHEIDISGWFVTDGDALKRLNKGKTTPLPEGTKLQAGDMLVFEGDINFTFGLGDQDSAILYNSCQELVDQFSWSKHADGTYQRNPETGEFEDKPATKGETNVTGETVKEKKPVINEVSSQPADYVELMNLSDSDINLGGMELRDSDEDHRFKFKDGTVIAANGYLTVDQNTKGLYWNDSNYTEGTFSEGMGLGSSDSIRLFDTDGNLIDSYSWTSHPSYNGQAAAYGRYPDGTGEFELVQKTPGKSNTEFSVNVRINEIETKDPDGPDWVELVNPSDQEIDISGLVLKDSEDKHAFTIADNTKIAAKGYYVIDSLGFGLGDNDSVRLFQNGTLIDSYAWTSHASRTWGRYPDMTGSEFRDTAEVTKGSRNVFAEDKPGETWPGSDLVKVFDTAETFLEDSSGLDFSDGKLYAIDNGTGKFWELNVNPEDGSMTFVPGFENGKRIRYQKDKDNSAAPGPDTEGITVDGNGMVYAAAERDNSAKGVNYDTILQVNPNENSTDLIAEHEWNITSDLPHVDANLGIEAVEWVPDSELNGKLFDTKQNAAYDSANYPDKISGVFFVALEDNGHVYAYALKNDNTFTRISEIDSTLGGAMSLDYDTYDHALWVSADNTYKNRYAKLTFNGTAEPETVRYEAAEGEGTEKNNEGFAIADVSYTRNGQRPVYHFADGEKSGALTIGSLNCDYADRSALQAAVAKAEAIDLNAYTVQSVQTLQDALANASNVSEHASQADVDALTQKLNDAIAGLTKKPSSSTGTAVSKNETAAVMYRLYNPNSGEHFYTSSKAEKENLIAAGWKDEGAGWKAASSGDPVYRLYNPNAGDHHYTMNEQERDTLISLGWKDEGVVMYSSADHNIPVYRLYNPNQQAHNHHYTASVEERNKLVSLGWQDEGIGWYSAS